MKIFNVENGEKCVYVQFNDLAHLMHFGNAIPEELITEVFTDVFIVNDTNRWQFMRFSSPNTVSFFENLDWVPDYKRFRGLKESEILAYGQELIDAKNQIADEHNDPNTTDEKREELFERFQLLEYKINSLAEILWVKQGHIEMPFPIVPDSDGFTLENDDDSLYGSKQGINPLQHLIYRKDGKPFDKSVDKSIPQGLVAGADTLCVMSNSENNEFFGNFQLSRSLTEDKKYLVTTMKMFVPEEEMEKGIKGDIRSLGKRLKDKVCQFGRNIKKKLEEM